MYVIDLGRNGVGLLHGERPYPKERLRVVLYPNERLRVVLLGRSLRQIEIVRCERGEERCYSIGARFVDQCPVAGLVPLQGARPPNAVSCYSPPGRGVAYSFKANENGWRTPKIRGGTRRGGGAPW
jgi:hypothetical protein